MNNIKKACIVSVCMVGCLHGMGYSRELVQDAMHDSASSGVASLLSDIQDGQQLTDLGIVTRDKGKKRWHGPVSINVETRMQSLEDMQRTAITYYEDAQDYLIAASVQGNKKAIKKFCKYGADVNGQDAEGNTALMLASQQGHLDAVTLLLDLGADVNKQNKGGRTVLFGTSCPYVLRCLLDQEATVDHQDAEGDTALMDAIRNQYYDAMECLVAYGASRDIKNSAGVDALTLASSSLASEGVADEGRMRMLLAEDATLRAMWNWRSPDYSLTRAMDALEKLLQETAYLEDSAEDSDGDEKQYNEEDGEIASSSQQRSTDMVRRGNVAKMTPVMDMLRNDLQEIMGAYRTIGTLFFYAAQRGNVAVLAFLSHPETINYQDAEGNTALMLAAQQGHLAAVQLLLERGAEVNKQNKNGDTALILAVCAKFPVFEALARKGASGTIKNNAGESAISLIESHLDAENRAIKKLRAINARGLSWLKIKKFMFERPILTSLLTAGGLLGTTGLLAMTRYSHPVRRFPDDAWGVFSSIGTTSVDLVLGLSTKGWFCSMASSK